MHPRYDRYDIEHLDHLRRTFFEAPESIDYLRYYERTGGSDQPLGRFDLAPEQLGLDPEDDPDPTYDDYFDAFLETFLAAACPCADGGRACFRIRAYEPKGGHTPWIRAVNITDRHASPEVDLATLVGETSDEPEEEDQPELNLPEVPRDEGADRFAWLDHFYRKALTRQLHSTGRLTQLYDGMILRLDRRLDKAEARSEKVISALLDYRTLEADRAFEQQSLDSGAALKAEVAKSALDQLGDAARLYMAAQVGIPPELVEVVELVGEHPELVEALKDPAVRVLLKDPDTVAAVAGLIRHAAHAAAEEDPAGAADIEPLPAADPDFEGPEGPQSSEPSDPEPPSGGPL